MHLGRGRQRDSGASGCLRSTQPQRSAHVTLGAAGEMEMQLFV